MDRPFLDDLIDWHGCDAVQFNPKKLSGKATVGDTRLDADTVLINYEGGLSIDEIVDSFGADREAVKRVVAFAALERSRLSA